MLYLYLSMSCYLFNDFRLAKKPGLIKPYLSGGGEARWQGHAPGLLHTTAEERGASVRGAIAGGAGVMVTALGCYLILE